jgi:hypothetical protein
MKEEMKKGRKEGKKEQRQASKERRREQTNTRNARKQERWSTRSRRMHGRTLPHRQTGSCVGHEYKVEEKCGKLK